jgi:hypothetical protein
VQSCVHLLPILSAIMTARVVSALLATCIDGSVLPALPCAGPQVGSSTLIAAWGPQRQGQGCSCRLPRLYTSHGLPARIQFHQGHLPPPPGLTSPRSHREEASSGGRGSALVQSEVGGRGFVTMGLGWTRPPAHMGAQGEGWHRWTESTKWEDRGGRGNPVSMPITGTQTCTSPCIRVSMIIATHRHIMRPHHQSA